jgi:hypothetical protein
MASESQLGLQEVLGPEETQQELWVKCCSCSCEGEWALQSYPLGVDVPANTEAEEPTVLEHGNQATGEHKLRRLGKCYSEAVSWRQCQWVMSQLGAATLSTEEGACILQRRASEETRPREDSAVEHRLRSHCQPGVMVYSLLRCKVCTL